MVIKESFANMIIL